MTPSNKKYIWILVVLVIVAIFLGIKSVQDKATSPSPIPSENSITKKSLQDLPIFKDGLASVGVALDSLGFHTFSPDGAYFVFTGIKDGDTIPAKTYLVDLATGEIKELPGIMLRGFEDWRIIALFKDTDLLLYDPRTGTYDTIPTDGNIFAGVLSPDGTKYSFDTLKGTRVYNRATKTIEVLNSSQYDGASAWFADNIRMLGYKNNGMSRFEAGYGRDLGIWNTTTKEFTPFSKKVLDQIPTDLIGSATWIIPDKIARINTGWDDGSHDYLFDIQAEKIIDLGETSGALMGGMREDVKRGLFALLNTIEGEDPRAVATLYKGMDKLKTVELTSGYIRENMQIIDENSLLYIRKHLNSKYIIESVELVKLDLGTGVETVLRELSKTNYSMVSLSPDRKHWIASDGSKFFVGDIGKAK